MFWSLKLASRALPGAHEDPAGAGLPRGAVGEPREEEKRFALADINAVFSTPHWATLSCGVISAVIAGLFPIGVLVEVTSMGTLVAFALVCGGVIMLRHTHPEVPRPFTVPWSPYVPSLGVLLALAQIAFLPWTAWVRMIAWLLLGAVMWMIYGINAPQTAVGFYERVD